MKLEGLKSPFTALQKLQLLTCAVVICASGTVYPVGHFNNGKEDF